MKFSAQTFNAIWITPSESEKFAIKNAPGMLFSTSGEATLPAINAHKHNEYDDECVLIRLDIFETSSC